MERVALVLAYYFPPLGGAGAERAVHMARQLPDLGFRPLVLTGDGLPGHWSPLDELGVERLPADLEVVRVSARRPSRYLARFERLAMRSGYGRRFAEEACRLARPLRGRVDVLICEFGRYDMADAAIRLARELDVPWVADLQDPWALDEMWIYPTGLHRRADLRRMRGVLEDAAAVIMNTAEAASRVRRAFPELPVEKIHAIPNGFDAAEFRSGEPVPRNERFRIVHTGTMHTALGLRHRRTLPYRRILGGMPVPGIDFLPRSHVFLLEAVGRLVARDPSLAGRIEIHLAGPMTAADLAVAQTSRLTRVHGMLPHADAVRLVRSADLLFLPMHRLPRGVRAGLVPTKTYEYAASGQPILAAVPEGDARDFLRAVGTATTVEPDDVDGLERAVETHFESWRRGDEPPSPDASALEPYEYRSVVARIASVLETVEPRAASPATRVRGPVRSEA
jgi:glycosyltransferase involved in cell wall biosynthesis